MEELDDFKTELQKHIGHRLLFIVTIAPMTKHFMICQTCSNEASALMGPSDDGSKAAYLIAEVPETMVTALEQQGVYFRPGILEPLGSC